MNRLSSYRRRQRVIMKNRLFEKICLSSASGNNHPTINEPYRSKEKNGHRCDFDTDLLLRQRVVSAIFCETNFIREKPPHLMQVFRKNRSIAFVPEIISYALSKTTMQFSHGVCEEFLKCASNERTLFLFCRSNKHQGSMWVRSLALLSMCMKKGARFSYLGHLISLIFSGRVIIPVSKQINRQYNESLRWPDSSTASWLKSLQMWQHFMSRKPPPRQLQWQAFTEALSISHKRKLWLEIKNHSFTPPPQHMLPLLPDQVCDSMEVDEEFVFLFSEIGYFCKKPYPLSFHSICSMNILWTSKVLRKFSAAYLRLFEAASQDYCDLTDCRVRLFLTHLDLHHMQGTLLNFLQDLIDNVRTNGRFRANATLLFVVSWMKRLRSASAAVLKALLYLITLSPKCNLFSREVFYLNLHSDRDTNFINAICHDFYTYESNTQCTHNLSDILFSVYRKNQIQEHVELLSLCGPSPYCTNANQDMINNVVGEVVQKRYIVAAFHIAKEFHCILLRKQITELLEIFRERPHFLVLFAKCLVEESASLSLSDCSWILQALLKTDTIPFKDILFGLRKIILHMDKRWLVLSPEAFQFMAQNMNHRYTSTGAKDALSQEIMFCVMTLYLRMKKIHHHVLWSDTFFTMVNQFPACAFQKTVLVGLWGDFHSTNANFSKSAFVRFPNIFHTIVLPKSSKLHADHKLSARVLSTSAIRHIYWQTSDVAFAHFACLTYSVSVASLFPYTKPEKRDLQRDNAREVVFKHSEANSSCESFVNSFRTAQLEETHFHRLHIYKLVLKSVKLSSALKALAAVFAAGHMILSNEVEHVLKLPSRLGWKNAMNLLRKLPPREQCEVGRSNALAFHFLPANHALWADSENIICSKGSLPEIVSVKHRKALRRRNAEESINGCMFFPSVLWSAACRIFHTLINTSANVCGTNALNQLIFASIEQRGNTEEVFKICQLYARKRNTYLYPVTIEYLLRNATSLNSSTVLAIEAYVKAYHYKNFLYEPQISLQIDSWQKEICSGTDKKSYFSDPDRTFSSILSDHALCLAHRITFKQGISFTQRQDRLEHTKQLVSALICAHNQSQQRATSIFLDDDACVDFIGSAVLRSEDIDRALVSSLISSRWEKAAALLYRRHSCGAFQLPAANFKTGAESAYQMALAINLIWQWTRRFAREISERKDQCHMNFDSRVSLENAFNTKGLREAGNDDSSTFLLKLATTSPFPHSCLGFFQQIAKNPHFMLTTELFQALRDVNDKSIVQLVESNAKISHAHRMNALKLFYDVKMYLNVLAMADYVSSQTLRENQKAYQDVHMACLRSLNKTYKSAWETYVTKTSDTSTVFVSFMCVEAANEENVDKCVQLLKIAARHKVPKKSFKRSLENIVQRLLKQSNKAGALLLLDANFLFAEEYISHAAIATLKHITEQEIHLKPQGVSHKQKTSNFSSSEQRASMKEYSQPCVNPRAKVQAEVIGQLYFTKSFIQKDHKSLLRFLDPSFLHKYLSIASKTRQGNFVILLKADYIQEKIKLFLQAVKFNMNAKKPSLHKDINTPFPAQVYFLLNSLQLFCDVVLSTNVCAERALRYISTRSKCRSVLNNKERMSELESCKSYLSKFDSSFYPLGMIERTIHLMYSSCEIEDIPQFVTGLHCKEAKHISNTSRETLRFACEAASRYQEPQSTNLYDSCLSALNMKETYLLPRSTWEECFRIIEVHADCDANSVSAETYLKVLAMKIPVDGVSSLLRCAKTTKHAYDLRILKSLCDRASKDTSHSLIALETLQKTLSKRAAFEQSIVGHIHKLMRVF